MRIEATRQALEQGLAAVRAWAPKRTTIAVLSHLRIVGEPSGLTLWATDLDVTCRYRVGASEDLEISEPGEVVVPADRLSDLVRNATSDRVSLRSDGQRLVFKAGRGRFHLMGLNPMDFPQMPEAGEEVCTMRVAGDVLADACRFTRGAVSGTESKFQIMAAWIELDGSGFVMVGTDGHRLHTSGGPTRSVEGDLSSLVGEDMEAGAFIPRRVLLAPFEGDEVGLGFHARHTVLEWGPGSEDGWGVRLTSRVPEGRFPDWRRVISSSGGEAALRVRSDELAPVLKRSRVMLGDRLQMIRLVMSAKQIEVRAASPDYGTSEEVVPCSGGPKEETEMCFAPAYVLEAIEAAGSEEVEILVPKNPTTPAILRPAGEERRLCVLCPIRP